MTTKSSLCKETYVGLISVPTRIHYRFKNCLKLICSVELGHSYCVYYLLLISSLSVDCHLTSCSRNPFSLQICVFKTKCQDVTSKWILLYPQHDIICSSFPDTNTEKTDDNIEVSGSYTYNRGYCSKHSRPASQHEGRQDSYLNVAQCLIYHSLTGGLRVKMPMTSNAQKTHSLISINTSLILMAFLALVSTKMAWMESA